MKSFLPCATESSVVPVLENLYSAVELMSDAEEEGAVFLLFFFGVPFTFRLRSPDFFSAPPGLEGEFLADAVTVSHSPFASHASTPLRRRSRASSISPPPHDSGDEAPTQRTQSTLRRWFQSFFEGRTRASDSAVATGGKKSGHQRR